MDSSQPSTSAPQTEASQEETVPMTWPGAFGLYHFSRNAVRVNVWTLVALILINVVTSGIITSALQQLSLSRDAAQMLASLFGAWISLAIVVTVLAGIRQQKISVGESLRQAGSFYINGVLLSVATFIIITASLLLFVVPFFFVMPRLSLATYFLVDKKLGVVDALKASWETTRGNVGKVWAVIGVTILFALLIFVLVGIYFLIMYLASTAILYIFLTQAHKATDDKPADKIAEPAVDDTTATE